MHANSKGVVSVDDKRGLKAMYHDVHSTKLIPSATLYKGGRGVFNRKKLQLLDTAYIL